MVLATRNNEDIKKDIVDQLYWDDRVDASHVKVEVTDRTARLSGHIASYTARRAAETDAWLIAGVASVDNRLEVSSPPEHTRPTDEDLRAELAMALSWNSELQGTDIEVSVRDGRVTLIGSVDVHWKKRIAEELVAGRVGTVDVKNELAVVPSQRFEDRLVAGSIISALERNMHVEASAIDVRVNEGVVTLSGSVSSVPEFRAVGEVASRTIGVIALNNEVTIR